MLLFVVLDRTPMHQGSDNYFCVQHNPKFLRSPSYPARVFSRDKLMRIFDIKYEKLLIIACEEREFNVGRQCGVFEGAIFRARQAE